MPTVVYTFSAVNQQDVLHAYQTIQVAAEVTQSKQNMAAMKGMATQREVNRRRIAGERAWARAAVDAAEKKMIAEKMAAKATIRAMFADTQSNLQQKKKLSLYQRAILLVKSLGNASVTAAKREELAVRRVNQERAKGASLGKMRSMPGGTGMIGLGVTAGLMGGMVVGAAGRKALTTDEMIVQLAIKGRRPGQKINTKALKDKIYGSAIAAGVDPAELTKSLRAYVGKTGDLGTASKFTDVFAKYISLGTSGEDIGKGAAFLGMKFGKGKGKGILTAAGMDQSLGTLAVGGKRHQFELPDFAKQLPKIASAMERFNYKNVGFGAVAQMGGWAQLAAKGTSGGAQAGTALENIMADLLGKNKTILTDLGVNMKTKGGEMRNFEDIILDVLTATGGQIIGSGSKKKGDLKLGLTDIFNRRGIRGMSAITAKFAEFQEEGGAAGLDKAGSLQFARDEMVKFMATMKDMGDAVAETNQDAAYAQQSASNRLISAWAAVEQAASKQLVPALDGLIGNLPKLVDASRMLMLAFQALGFGVMALLDRLPDSAETKLAKAKVNRVSAEQEMQDLGERMKLHSTGKVRMTDAETAAVAGRFNVISDELYGADGEPGLLDKERAMTTDLLNAKSGRVTISTEEGPKMMGPGEEPTKGEARKLIAQTMGVDLWDLANIPGHPMAYGGISPAANIYERVKDVLGLNKGKLARAGDFVSFFGRGSPEQKETAARGGAGETLWRGGLGFKEAAVIQKEAAVLQMSAAKAFQAAAGGVGGGTAHPVKPGKTGPALDWSDGSR
jgi:hypothetical protein